MYYCEAALHTFRARFRRPKNIGLCILFAHTQKHTHILVTAPHTDAAPHIPLTTQKKHPTFRRGADIIADNINYFSTLLFCAIYAFFASLAALLASRLTFK